VQGPVQTQSSTPTVSTPSVDTPTLSTPLASPIPSHNKHYEPITSSSPARSSSTASPGYVGWPGTQDAHGHTIQPNKSYELHTGDRSSSSSSGANIHREASRWTGQRREVVSQLRLRQDENTPVCNRLQRGASCANKSTRSETAASLRHVDNKDRITAAATRALEMTSQLAGENVSMSSTPSSPSATTTILSKTSSAYMHVTESDELAYLNYTHRQREEDNIAYDTESRLLKMNKTTSLAMSSGLSNIHAPTLESLAVNNRFTPPHRTFSTKGYDGLLNKTKEVPCLADAMDSDASSKSTSISVRPPSAAGSYHARIKDNDSDVFDDLSLARESDVFDNLPRSPVKRTLAYQSSLYPSRIVEEETGAEKDDFKVVLLGGGLTSIQATSEHFTNRCTAVDYDENLTNSDIDQYGYARTPGFSAMLTAGTLAKRDSSLLGIQSNLSLPRSSRMVSFSEDEDDPKHISDPSIEADAQSMSFSDPYGDGDVNQHHDLSQYYIEPAIMKQVLRRYRHFSNRVIPELPLAEFEREEDENKSFALFEMRSRIMEKDIERGLERRGGTSVVDDIVCTPFYKTSYRVRDALIVAKAWRDGASPQDVVKTAILTRRDSHTYYIRRKASSSSSNSSVLSSSSSARFQYFWEPVRWMDDTEFSLFTCPSLGPRHMHGFEMFTIGDCQSILLKLTNERRQVSLFD
jgi:hypothetical protein